MVIDNESFELLVVSVQRFVRERLMPADNDIHAPILGRAITGIAAFS